jgi:hypothetical protein
MYKCVIFSVIGVAAFLSPKLAGQDSSGNILQFNDPTGVFSTIIGGSPGQSTNAFFQSLGTNGRACATCHVASDGWTIVPAHIQQRFSQSLGLDPLFRTNDGSNCAGADVSSRDKATVAYSLLLNKGLIRVQLPIPRVQTTRWYQWTIPIIASRSPGTFRSTGLRCRQPT